MIDMILSSFRTEFEGLLELAPRAVAALFILLFAYILGRLLGHVIFLVLRKTELTQTHRLFFRRLIHWVVVLLGSAVALSVIGLGNIATGLIASGGLTAVVIGFAFREIGENLLAGFFLAFSRPFNQGDLIQSGDFEGTVRTIQLRSTHIRTVDGRDIFIPNSQIFNRPLVNYTLDGLRRPQFKVGIDYADDSKRACGMLRKAVQSISGVLPQPGVETHISSLLPNYVELSVGFWVNTFDKGHPVMEVRDNVIEACRLALRDGGFTLSTDVVSNMALLGGQRPVGVAMVSSD